MTPGQRQAVIRDSGLPSSARFLWLVIETYADPDGSNAFPSIETLAAVCGHNRKWVCKYLAVLKKSGHIVTKKRVCKSGLGNLFQLVSKHEVRPQKRDDPTSPKRGQDHTPMTRGKKDLDIRFPLKRGIWGNPPD